MEKKKHNETKYQFYHFGEELIDKVMTLLGSNYIPVFNKTSITIYGGNKRILKLVNTLNYLNVEFNVSVSRVDDLTILTKEEAKVKKMATCQWIYKGKSLETVLNLVKEAKKNFCGKS